MNTSPDFGGPARPAAPIDALIADANSAVSRLCSFYDKLSHHTDRLCGMSSVAATELASSHPPAVFDGRLGELEQALRDIHHNLSRLDGAIERATDIA